MTISEYQQSEASLFIDTHVHIYKEYDLNIFFDAAIDRFRFEAQKIGLTTNIDGCLMLAETSYEHFFRKLKNPQDRPPLDPRFSIEYTEEACSIYIKREDGARLILIAGRQLNTKEGLEVLALGSDQEFSNDLSIACAIQEIATSEALAVVPWGVGKWWSKRGALLRSLFIEKTNYQWFIGDNAARPRISLTSRLFMVAKLNNVRVLPGTDSLPLRRHQTVAGGYGFVIQNLVDERRPMQSIKQWLIDNDRDPFVFGKRRSWWDLIICQIALRLKKYVGR